MSGRPPPKPHKARGPLASFSDSFPQLAPVVPPSIFDLLFGRTSIVGGRDQGYCAVDTNQDHSSDSVVTPGSRYIWHTRGNTPSDDGQPLPLNRCLANEGIDDMEFDGGVRQHWYGY
jgi:hypothetical protein